MLNEKSWEAYVLGRRKCLKLLKKINTSKAAELDGTIIIIIVIIIIIIKHT